MRKAFNIFKIKREERWQALVALLLFTVLNALTIIKYNSQFIQLTDNYHKLFVGELYELTVVLDDGQRIEYGAKE